MKQQSNILEPMPLQSDAIFEGLLAKVSAAAVVRRDEALAKRTTLRVGGTADFYVEPAEEADLAAVVRGCAEWKLPFFILGRGSNLLVRDRGFRGVVICLSKPAFSQIEVNGGEVACGAGARLKAVANEAKRHGLGGLEFLEGIPGSVGGGLRMNAGAMGGAMFDLVQSVRLMDFAGNLCEVTRRDLEVSYRNCATIRSHVALGCVLAGHPGTRESIEQRMKEYSQKRWKSQPAAASAGCMFKNPAAVPAGKLIEELGLKGRRVGGAFVSAEHGNFIVNDGTATASQVLELVEIIRERARAERNIELETEVEVIGE